MKDIPYVFELFDYSPVRFSKEEDIKKLRSIFPHIEKEGDLIGEFCDTVQEYLEKYRSSEIVTIGDTGKVVRLFWNRGKEIYVKGYCGVISLLINNEPITIIFNSRFSRNNSFFLLHVFETALGIKGCVYDDMRVAGKKERAWDYMLMLIFLKQFHEAFKGGVYREYREFDHNDSNVKGRIDIPRHIKENLLNNGKVAYTTREYTPDNYINILILKAFERLRISNRTAINNYLSQDDVINKGVNTLKTELTGFNDYSDIEILKRTNRKIVKNVFGKYEELRKTSIFILKRYGINGFVQMNQRSNGILIDMPGLWEQYLYKMLFSYYEESDNKEYRQEAFSILFEEIDGKMGVPKREVKPDYLIGYKNRKYAFDAKYKLYWSKALNDDDWEKSREDVFQVMSYMYLFECRYGGIVFPYDGGDGKAVIRKYYVGQNRIKDQIILIPIEIPQNEDWMEFKDSIKNEFEKKKNELRTIMDAEI